ncbi:MAG: hypothetical protein AMXMBFR55_28870 [Gemmatimonadota bacterium]
MERRKVDFPHPDGPMNAVTERAGIVRSMECSACFSPYQKEKRLASMVPVETGDGRREAGVSIVSAVIRTFR